MFPYVCPSSDCIPNRNNDAKKDKTLTEHPMRCLEKEHARSQLPLDTYASLLNGRTTFCQLRLMSESHARARN